MPPHSLAGRRALVTGAGAGTGIGRAIAHALAAAGARVAVTDIDGDAAERVAGEIGGIARRLDVLHADETVSVITSVARELGGLEIVCANAGVSSMSPVVDLTETEWDRNMAVNAKGVFLTNQAAMRHFLATGTKGVIVNTASLAGKIGAPLLQQVRRHRLHTGAGAREVASHGIRELRLPRLRAHLDAGARGGVGGTAARPNTRAGARRLRRPDPARPPRGARERGSVSWPVTPRRS